MPTKAETRKAASEAWTQLRQTLKDSGHKPKKKKPKPGGWGGLQKLALQHEQVANTLMELDMRGELADSPYEKGVVRVKNRWDQGKGKKNV